MAQVRLYCASHPRLTREGPVTVEMSHSCASEHSNRRRRTGTVGRGSRASTCLTDGVAKDDQPLPSKDRNQRQFVVFSLVAVVAVWMLVLLAYTQGALHTLGLVVGVPIVALLLLIGFRFRAENPN